MIWFKRCRKCRGDMYHANDNDAPCILCLQCGSRYYLGVETLELSEINIPSEFNRKEAVLAR